MNVPVPPVMEDTEAVVHFTQSVNVPVPPIMEEQIADVPVLHVKEGFVESEDPERCPRTCWRIKSLVMMAT